MSKNNEFGSGFTPSDSKDYKGSIDIKSKELHIYPNTKLEEILRMQRLPMGRFSTENLSEESLKNSRRIKGDAQIKLWERKPQEIKDYTELLDARCAMFPSRSILWQSKSLQAAIELAVIEKWSAKKFLYDTKDIWCLNPSQSVEALNDYNNNRRQLMIDAKNRSTLGEEINRE